MKTKRTNQVQKPCKIAVGAISTPPEMAKAFVVNASKSTPRKGRPERFSQGLLSLVGKHWPEANSHRARQDKAFMHRAIRTLGYSRKYEWLGLESLAKAKSSEGFIRATVLTELGRIQAEEMMRDCALMICRLAPHTQRQAVKMVRHWRCSEFNGYVNVIAVRIGEAIRQCKAGMPAIQADDIVGALDAVGSEYRSDPACTARRVEWLVGEIRDRADAIKVLQVKPQSASCTAAAAVVLIMPELSELGMYRKVAETRRGEPGESSQRAAKLFGVSSRYIRKARFIRDANPELFSKMLNGKVTLSQAHRQTAGG